MRLTWAYAQVSSRWGTRHRSHCPDDIGELLGPREHFR
jgi:hypothetical protein